MGKLRRTSLCHNHPGMLTRIYLTLMGDDTRAAKLFKHNELTSEGNFLNAIYTSPQILIISQTLDDEH